MNWMLSLCNMSQRVIIAGLMRIFLLVMLGLFSKLGLAAECQVHTAFSLLGQPRYTSDFQHFAYANPLAPKGGEMRFAVIGNFDNFNRYALRGNSAERSEQLFDSLFTMSEDEAGSYYPLIALSACTNSDYSQAKVTLNPAARFHDGRTITADDVTQTFQKFMQEGVPQFRVVYKGATMQTLSPDTLLITLPQGDKDKLLGLLSLPVLPQHDWQNRKLSDPLVTPPLGSGPYRIADYRMGQYVIYQRVADYWAAQLPVNRGRYNFDRLRYDYYLDDNVALEAFKTGAYDFRSEVNPKNWATQYQGKNITRGAIQRVEEVNHVAQNTRWLAFNVQRPQFHDRRVREAITLALNFEWLNKAFYYDAYQRTQSYFQNTPYAAIDSLPDNAELRWLMPYKDQLPAAVFDQIYAPPVNDTPATYRAHLLKATRLLEEAGWVIRSQQLVARDSGKPFSFELLLLSGTDYPYVLPLRHSLQRLGITMTVRTVDSAQYVNRMRKRDFDMMPTVYRAMNFPSADLQIMWGSSYINASYNRPGFTSPVTDDLINQIIRHQGDETELISLGRALDRVLLWNHLMIPLWYSGYDRFAYWDKFARPSQRPLYSLGLDSWWYDAQKATRLSAPQSSVNQQQVSP